MLSIEWILNNKISGIKLVFSLYATIVLRNFHLLLTSLLANDGVFLFKVPKGSILFFCTILNSGALWYRWAGISWVRFRVDFLIFFIDIILPDAPWLWARLSLQQTRVLRLSPGRKWRPVCRADILVTQMYRYSRKTWQRSSGALGFCPSLYRVCFTCYYVKSCISFCLTVHTLFKPRHCCF